MFVIKTIYLCEDLLRSSWDFVFVGSTEAPSKVFLCFFLFSDWLKSDHLKSRIELVFDNFLRHIHPV